MKTIARTIGTMALVLTLVAGLGAGSAYGQGATGGTITHDDTVWVHTFTNTAGSANFVVTQQIQNVEILVVGGGGAGGGYSSTTVGNGGGGGGDFVTNSYAQLAAQTIVVTVGTGAVGGTGVGPTGGTSSATIVSPATTITAIGGGGGGCRNPGNGRNGGSGGGGAYGGLGGTNIGIRGSMGGSHSGSAGYGGAGGGGASAAGASTTSDTGGNGGEGLAWHGVTYSSGGGGGSRTSGGTNGVGGTNAGNGGYRDAVGGAAPASYGGGGGGASGGSSSSRNGGNGGSGVVIFRYEIGSGAISPLTQNSDASGVGTNKATLNGALTDIGTPSASAVFVLWGPNPSAWVNTNFWTGGGWTNNTPFSTNVTTGISVSNNYYYTFAASNSSLTGTASPAQYFITGEIGLSSSDSSCDVNAADTAVVTVVRPSVCTNEQLTINYALSGTGTNYVTASPASGFKLAAGQASTNITFTPVRPNSGAPVNATLTLLAGAYPSDNLASYPVTVATAASTSLTASSDTQIGNALNVVETPPTTVACSVAGSTYTYDFWTSSLNLNGKRIYYAGTRNLVLANLSALTDSGTGWLDTSSSVNFTSGGGVTVQAPNGIAIHGTNASGYAIDTASASSQSGNGGSVTLATTGGVSLTAGGIRAFSAANPAGNISITDGAGGSAGNVSIAGPLDARSTYSSTPATNVFITVRGDAVGISNSVLAIQAGAYNRGGDILLVASGPLTVGGYLAAQSINSSYCTSGGAVTLTGATVTVSGTTNGISVSTWCATNYGSNAAGDIRVVATSGNLTLAGGVDVWHPTANSRGNVVLAAPNGSLTVGSLDASRFKTISVQTGTGTYDSIYVTGVLTNFTVSEAPKKFTFPTAGSAVSNDIYYSLAYNGAGLSGEYSIFVATTDTGKKLKQGPPPSQSSTPATVVNLAPTNVTGTGATFRGFLEVAGDPTAAVSVVWGEADGAAGGGWANTNGWSAGAWGSASYPSTNILTLTAGRNYFYTFGAQNLASNVLATNVQYLITGSLTPAQGDGACGASMSDTATIVISRPADLTNGALAVNYALSGAGTNYVSVSPASGFTLAAGQVSTNIVFTPVRPNPGAPLGVTLTLLPGAYPSDALASDSISVATAVGASLTASNDTQIGAAMNVIENPPTTVACSVTGSTYTYDFWASSLNLNGKRIYYAGTRNLVLANLGALTDSGTGCVDTSSSASYTPGGGVTVQAPGGIVLRGINASGYAIDAASTAGPGLGGSGGSVALVATGGVSLTAGGLRALSAGGLAGNISISDGAGGSAGNVTIAGPLDASSAYSTTPIMNFSITVRGAAVGISNSVLAIQAGAYNSGGAITLLASGPLTIGGYVAAQATYPAYCQNGGAVTLTGTTVTVSGSSNGMSINTWCVSNHNSNVAGDIRVTATAGDLTLAGGLDASHPTTNSRGSVVLSAPNGRITVGSLDAARFKSITLSVGASHLVLVTGVLTNFVVSESPKTITFPANSVITSHIYYDYVYNTAIPLSGEYAIYVATANTGYELRDRMSGAVYRFR